MSLFVFRGALLWAILCVIDTESFTFVPNTKQTSSSRVSSLHMGLFDGVKEAFSAPALERSSLDAERETPIDRWMGWNVKGEEQSTIGETDDFVDSMEGKNYAIALLPKPMGIVFEENDDGTGGIFVLSISENGAAAAEGSLKPGDQLVAVNDRKVFGLSFDDALGAIVESQEDRTKLICFRGKAEQLYGPTGASQEWLDEFIAKQ